MNSGANLIALKAFDLVGLDALRQLLGSAAFPPPAHVELPAKRNAATLSAIASFLPDQNDYHSYNRCHRRRRTGHRLL